MIVNRDVCSSVHYQPAGSTSSEERSNIMWPTYSPTVSHAPTTSAAPSMCIGNTIDWVDIDGDGCNWYEANDLPGCPYWGDWYVGDMGVANDNCCYCAGTGVSIIVPIIYCCL